MAEQMDQSEGMQGAMGPGEALLHPITLFVTDGSFKRIRILSSSGKDDFVYMVREGKRYNLAPHLESPVYGDVSRPRVVQLAIEGWTPGRDQGLAEEHRNGLGVCIAGRDAQLVTEVYLVCGAEDLCSDLRDGALLQSPDQQDKGAIALGGVMFAMIRLAAMYPRARIHYLGAGQLPSSPIGGGDGRELQRLGHHLRDVLPKNLEMALGLEKHVKEIEATLLGTQDLDPAVFPSVFPRLDASLAHSMFTDQMPARCFESSGSGNRFSRRGSREVLRRLQGLLDPVEDPASQL